MGLLVKRASAAVGVLLAACSGGGSDGKSSSLTGGNDAAVVDAEEPGAREDPRDAAEPEPDAELPDAGAPDDASTDAGPAFQLDVAFDGIPSQTLNVVLHEPTGAVREVLTTDARGHVESALAPAFATVILPTSVDSNRAPMPFTYAGVQPGDHLRLRVRDGAFYPDRAARGEVQASLLPVQIDTAWNAVQLELGMSSCHSGQGNTSTYTSANGELPPSITLGDYEECATTPLSLLASVLYRGEGVQPIGYSFLRDVPLPSASTPSSVALPDWVDPAYISLQPANLPAAYEGTTGSVHMVVGEERFETDYRRVPSASGLLGRRMPYAPGFGDALEVMGFGEAIPGNRRPPRAPSTSPCPTPPPSSSRSATA